MNTQFSISGDSTVGLWTMNAGRSSLHRSWHRSSSRTETFSALESIYDHLVIMGLPVSIFVHDLILSRRINGVFTRHMRLSAMRFFHSPSIGLIYLFGESRVIH